jgi:hypothetical protein
MWSEWVPFATALAVAPRQPGVYMAREGSSGGAVYIGMAGERRGQGIRGRLAIYASGKGLASGLGEAVLDRALADPEWLRSRLNELETSGPRRAKHWGIEAFARGDARTVPSREASVSLSGRVRLCRCWSQVPSCRSFPFGRGRRSASLLPQLERSQRLEM